MFNAEEWLATTGPFCYFDLDVIIQDSIDEFYDLAFKPHILYSHWQPEGQLKLRRFRDIRGTYFNSRGARAIRKSGRLLLSLGQALIDTP